MMRAFSEIDQLSASHSTSDAVRSAVKKIGEIAEYDAWSQRRSAAFNAIKQTELFHSIMKTNAEAKALEAKVVGSHEFVENSRDSMAGSREAWFKAKFGNLHSVLQQEGLYKPYMSGQLDRDIYLAKAWITATQEQKAQWGGEARYAKVSPEAKRIAEILHSTFKAAMDEERVVGAYRNNRPGFAFSQSHDATLIRRAARGTGAFTSIEKWTEADRAAYLSFLGERIDMAATTENLRRMGKLTDSAPTKEQLLESLWGVFATGARKDSSGSRVGGGNFAEKAESGRMIEFISPDAAYEYAQMFGGGSVANSVKGQLEDHAHTIATLRIAGPDAKANLDNARSRAASELRRKAEEARKNGKDGTKFEKRAADLQKDEFFNKAWSLYSGDLLAPENMDTEAWTNRLLAWQRMAKLGGATISSVTDVMSLVAQSSHAGINPLTAILQPFHLALDGLSGGEKIDFLRRTGIGLESILGTTAKKLDGDYTKPGGLTERLQNGFFRVTGLSAWTDHMKASYVSGLSSDYAARFGSSFDKLPEKMRREFSRYGINAAEWDVIRAHAKHDVNGWRVLAPDKIKGATDAEIVAMLGGKATDRQIAEARLGLENKLNQLFQDGADKAVLTADLRTQASMASMHYGARGTLGGALSRSALQFKSFPVAFFQKLIQGRYYDAGGGWKGAASVGKIFTAMSAMGLVVYLAKGYITQGREIPSLDDINNMEGKERMKLLMAGVAQGGGLGILTDYLFNTGYVEGRSQAASLVGPAGDSIFKGIENLYKTAINGEEMGDDWIRYIRGNMPGANIWWAKPMLDHYIWNSFMEAANPGSLQRMEESAAKYGRPYDPNHPAAWLFIPTSTKP